MLIFLTMASPKSTIQNVPLSNSQVTDMEMKQIIVEDGSDKITATLMPPPKPISNLPTSSKKVHPNVIAIRVLVNPILVMKKDSQLDLNRKQMLNL